VSLKNTIECTEAAGKVRCLFSFFEKLVKFSAARVEKHGARYISFGIFSVINYMLPMYMFSQNHSGNIAVQTIRIIAILLSFFLAISDAWYPSLKKYLPIYWHFTIMFCLPFMVTYMAFFDGVSIFWIINISLALMLGLILLDFLSFLIIFPMGIILAILISYALGHDAQMDMPNYLLYPSFYLVLFVLGITVTFFRDKEKEYDEKIKAMRTLAGAIAHEVRTPASTIALTLKGMNFSKLSPDEQKILNQKKERAEKEVKYILDSIEMILTKLSDNTSLPCKNMSAKDFIGAAIKLYPFSVNEASLVHVLVQEDFYFYINEHLMMHVIFNLIQNALRQIKEARRGEIFITITRNRKANILSIKDTATGIHKSRIDSIFTPFMVFRDNGTGIGLSFCKKVINSMNGELRCQSEYGEYAEFIMEF
jgi:signal transduction histidine kinase